MTDKLINQTLGRYKILNEIGRGGMGKVYLAEHIHTGKKVAVKTLLTGWLSDLNDHERRGIEERFRREAQAAAQISHQNVVQIYDFEMANEGFPAYIAMELLEGQSLENLLSSERLISEDRAISIMLQVCAGIAEAHKKGFVHRDLKPANIIVKSVGNNEEIKIVDFGIAKVFDSELTRITKSGQLLGTPKYMSPEQCGGESIIDTRTDVYSLGIIFYEMLCGKAPYEAESLQGWIVSHIMSEPKPFSIEISAELKSLIFQSLSKDRGTRPASAGELWEKLWNIEFDKKQNLKKKQAAEEEQRILNRIEEEKLKVEKSLKEQFERVDSIYRNRIADLEAEKKKIKEDFLGLIKQDRENYDFYLKGLDEAKALLKELQENQITNIIRRLDYYRKEDIVVIPENSLIAENNKEDDKNNKEDNDYVGVSNRWNKVRVYDLAKELKQDTRRIMEELRREGADVSVPSNSVSKELAEKIRNKYFPKKETAPARVIKVVKTEKLGEDSINTTPVLKQEEERPRTIIRPLKLKQPIETEIKDTVE